MPFVAVRIEPSAVRSSRHARAFSVYGTLNRPCSSVDRGLAGYPQTVLVLPDPSTSRSCLYGFGVLRRRDAQARPVQRARMSVRHAGNSWLRSLGGGCHGGRAGGIWCSKLTASEGRQE